MSNTFKFSSRSEKNLQGVNPDLVKVTRRALEISEVDFGITEGLRSRYRQKQLVTTGKSQTMNSRHLTGHAVDVVCNQVNHLIPTRVLVKGGEITCKILK